MERRTELCSHGSLDISFHAALCRIHHSPPEDPINVIIIPAASQSTSLWKPRVLMENAACCGAQRPIDRPGATARWFWVRIMFSFAAAKMFWTGATKRLQAGETPLPINQSILHCPVRDICPGLRSPPLQDKEHNRINTHNKTTPTNTTARGRCSGPLRLFSRLMADGTSAFYLLVSCSAALKRMVTIQSQKAESEMDHWGFYDPDVSQSTHSLLQRWNFTCMTFTAVFPVLPILFWFGTDKPDTQIAWMRLSSTDG